MVMARFTHQDILGTNVPLSTPLTLRFEIDENGVYKLVNHVIGPKKMPYVNGIFITGLTGEFPWLDSSKKKKMLDVTVDAVGGRIPVLFGATGNTTDETTELCVYGQDHGADAVVFAPLFFWGSNKKLPQEVGKVARSVTLPVYLYDNPYFAVLGPRKRERDIKTHIYKRIILENANVWGVKDSSGDMKRFQDYLSASIHKKGARVFLGDESKMETCPDTVPSFANLDPETCKILHDFTLDFDCKKKRRAQQYINDAGEIVYCRKPDGKSKNRGGLKYALSLPPFELCGETVLEPGQQLLPEEKSSIRDFVSKHYIR
jgi:dihydrodipicolinate synthase/N-acetylneuraminate lyase